MKTTEKYVPRCPKCFSRRVDLWLGGYGGLSMRKCLDCGYIGATFIEFEEKITPSKKEDKSKPVVQEPEKDCSQNRT